MAVKGIVRKVDELGRIVLPKEIRRTEGISEGTPMEIIPTTNGMLLKKYYAARELSDVIHSFSNAIQSILSLNPEPEKAGEIMQHVKEIQELVDGGQAQSGERRNGQV